jgi:hypothetical protein
MPSDVVTAGSRPESAQRRMDEIDTPQIRAAVDAWTRSTRKSFDSD